MMNNIVTATITAVDPIEIALANLESAGVRFVEVDRCPDGACLACGDSRFSTAA